MIRVQCFSHMDALKFENWPKVLACRPNVGDSIEASNSTKGKINRIIHAFEIIDGKEEPYLKLEIVRW